MKCCAAEPKCRPLHTPLQRHLMMSGGNREDSGGGGGAWHFTQMHRWFAPVVQLQRSAATGSDSRAGQWVRKHHAFTYSHLNRYPSLLPRLQHTLAFPPPPLSPLRPVTGKLEKVDDCVARLECAGSSRSVLLSIPATSIFPPLAWRYVIE